MADAKHTPGPWRSNWNGYYFEVIVGPQEFDPIICQVMVNVVALQQTRNDAEANAILIAAAPEMIEALKDVVVAHNMNTAEPESMKRALRYPIGRAIAAIALAEGRLIKSSKVDGDGRCEKCGGSGIQFVDAGNGNVNEDECWRCGGNGSAQ